MATIEAPEAAQVSDELDLRIVLQALTELKSGNFSTRLPGHWEGLLGKIADAFNETAERHEQLITELERVSRAVGREGRVHERASLGRTSGAWRTSIDAINQLIGDLVQPTIETARVIGAVAKGDLSQ